MRLKLRSLDLDKYLMEDQEYTWPDVKLDESYIERGILGLFSIDVVRLTQTKAALLKNFRMQPSEVDQMVYWEFEYFINALNQQVKEENDRQQAEMDKYKVNDRMASMNRQPKINQPKYPSFGSFKAPSMKF